VLGIEGNREVLTFFDGDVAMDPSWQRMAQVAAAGDESLTLLKAVRGHEFPRGFNSAGVSLCLATRHSDVLKLDTAPSAAPPLLTRHRSQGGGVSEGGRGRLASHDQSQAISAPTRSCHWREARGVTGPAAARGLDRVPVFYWRTESLTLAAAEPRI
jgi:hypothetical protein